MEGCEFVWKCRLLEKDARRIHIIVMSSQKESGGAVEALDSGAGRTIFAKPLVRDELYARIRSAARLLAYQKDLSFYAARDSLTGLLNRHTFTKKVKSILEDPFTVPVCFVSFGRHRSFQVGPMIPTDTLPGIGLSKRLPSCWTATANLSDGSAVKSSRFCFREILARRWISQNLSGSRSRTTQWRLALRKSGRLSASD